MFYHLCVWRLQFYELESPYGFVLPSDTHLSHSVHHWPGNSKDAELTVQALALDICLIMDIKEEREGHGVNWKIGIDIYTLLILCIK